MCGAITEKYQQYLSSQKYSEEDPLLVLNFMNMDIQQQQAVINAMVGSNAFKGELYEILHPWGLWCGFVKNNKYILPIIDLVKN